LEPQDALFNYEREKGHWVEVAPGEYASVYGEECDCFKLFDKTVTACYSQRQGHDATLQDKSRA
jgi:hypothetical protein